MDKHILDLGLNNKSQASKKTNKFQKTMLKIQNYANLEIKFPEVLIIDFCDLELICDLDFAI